MIFKNIDSDNKKIKNKIKVFLNFVIGLKNLSSKKIIKL